jgi:cytochrome o ubiquinol oxidase operon protein cyoD
MSYKSYTIGFVLSLALTLTAFFIVVHPGAFHMASGALLAAILTLAVVQLVVQLLFFLHLGSAGGWKLSVLLSTIALVLIIVIGSIWIMNHLNYSMTPAQMDQYMQDQQGGF